MENWDDKFDYLSAAGWTCNPDYWEFLVRTVWRIHEHPCRVVDFGCGYGRAGLFLMPLLAPGSTYTGFDQSQVLLDQGRPLFANQPFEATLLHGDVHAAPFEDGRFDVAIAHVVLMHAPRPQQVLAEMIRVTRHGGLVITCDATRNAQNALFYIHESEEHDHSPLALVQTMNATIRRRDGIDYNIGTKMPVLMHQAGLRNIQARINDRVWLLFPPVDSAEKDRMFRHVCNDR